MVDVAALLATGAVGALVGTVAGVALLHAAAGHHDLPEELARGSVAAWLGIVVVTTVVLSWSTPSVALHRTDAREAGLLGIAVLGLGVLAFRVSSDPRSLVVVLVLVWAAVRFRLRGVSTAALAMVAIADWSVARQMGPFGSGAGRSDHRRGALHVPDLRGGRPVRAVLPRRRARRARRGRGPARRHQRPVPPDVRHHAGRHRDHHARGCGHRCQRRALPVARLPARRADRHGPRLAAVVRRAERRAPAPRAPPRGGRWPRDRRAALRGRQRRDGVRRGQRVAGPRRRRPHRFRDRHRARRHPAQGPRGAGPARAEDGHRGSVGRRDRPRLQQPDRRDAGPVGDVGGRPRGPGPGPAPAGLDAAGHGPGRGADRRPPELQPA